MSGSGRWAAVALALAAVWLPAATVHAQAAETAWLQWVRDPLAEGCAVESSITARVEARLHRRVFADRATAQTIVTGRVYRSRTSPRWRATLSVTRYGESRDDRSISSDAQSCRPLEDAVVLVLSMVLDMRGEGAPAEGPATAAGAPASSPGSTTGGGASTPAPVPGESAPTGGGAGAGEGAGEGEGEGGAEATAPAVDAGGQATRASSSAASTAGARPDHPSEPRSAAVRARSASGAGVGSGSASPGSEGFSSAVVARSRAVAQGPAPHGERASEHWGAALSAGPVASIGLLPTLTGGVRIAARATSPARFSLELDLIALGESETSMSEGRAIFSALTAAISLCRSAWQQGLVEAGLCAGLEVGRVRAEFRPAADVELVGRGSQDVLVAEALAGTWMSVQVGPWVQLGASATLAMPFERFPFEIEIVDSRGNTLSRPQIHKMSWISGQLALHALLQLP